MFVRVHAFEITNGSGRFKGPVIYLVEVKKILNNIVTLLMVLFFREKNISGISVTWFISHKSATLRGHPVFYQRKKPRNFEAFTVYFKIELFATLSSLLRSMGRFLLWHLACLCQPGCSETCNSPSHQGCHYEKLLPVLLVLPPLLKLLLLVLLVL